jgi:hypothetical protein
MPVVAGRSRVGLDIARLFLFASKFGVVGLRLLVRG